MDRVFKKEKKDSPKEKEDVVLNKYEGVRFVRVKLETSRFCNRRFIFK